MSKNRPLMPFDSVVYSGEKFRSELRNKIGIVLSKVGNSKTTYVVDFDSASFILQEENLSHWRSRNKDEHTKLEQDIIRARKKSSED